MAMAQGREPALGPRLLAGVLLGIEVVILAITMVSHPVELTVSRDWLYVAILAIGGIAVGLNCLAIFAPRRAIVRQLLRWSIPLTISLTALMCLQALVG